MPKFTFAILLVVGFALMLGMTVISPFLPEFAGRHSANGFWIGMIFAGFGISRGIIMPIVGKLSDKKGRKIFITSGLFLFTVISMCYPIAKSVQMLTVVRICHGLAAGLVMPIIFAYIGDLIEKGKEGITSGILNMIFYLGLAAGPFFGGIINQYYGFNTVFYAMAAVGALTFFLALFFLPETTGTAKNVAHNEGNFRKLIKYNFIKAVLLMTLIITLMTIVYVSFVPSLAEKIKVNTEHVGFLVSIGIFLAGILQIPFGKIADRLDKPGRAFQVSIGASISMFALLVMPFCPSFTALMIAGAFVGIGSAVATPALMSLAIGIGQKTGMGEWMGILQASKSVAFVIAPLVFGIVMDHMGVDAVFYVLGIFCFIGGLGYLHYVRRRIMGYKQG